MCDYLFALSDASPGNPELLAAASKANNLSAVVVMTCTSNAENNAAALELAEIVLRLAVKQNPRSLRATTDLATCLMKAASCVTLDPCSPQTAKTDLVCLARYRQAECAIIYLL